MEGPSHGRMLYRTRAFDLYMDNFAATLIDKNMDPTKRRRLIDNCTHHHAHHTQAETVLPIHIRSEQNLADLQAKPFSGPSHGLLTSGLHITPALRYPGVSEDIQNNSTTLPQSQRETLANQQTN